MRMTSHLTPEINITQPEILLIILSILSPHNWVYFVLLSVFGIVIISTNTSYTYIGS